MKVLVVTGHYLPSTNAGGPVRSLANLIDMMGDEFEFKVLTSDRDMGSRHPYSGIQVDSWQSVGKAQVLYLSPRSQSVAALRRLLQSTAYDLLYLNSFFFAFTVKALLLRHLRQIRKTPVVLAPRGEFSEGATKIKRRKKIPYLFLVNVSGFCRGIIWHASSEYEADDIQRSMLSSFNTRVATPLSFGKVAASPSTIRIARDLVSGQLVESGCEFAPARKQPGELRAVFLSRVSPMKNLDFALEVLRTVRCRVQVDIFGPLEDARYWEYCQYLIGALPPQVKVRYCGAVPHEQVPAVLSKYHLLFVPTRGENFGHVFMESFLAGCPVLISDQTSWRELETSHIGWDIPISAPGRFRAVLEQCAAMDQAEFNTWSESARNYAKSFVTKQVTTELESYRQLFTPN